MAERVNVLMEDRKRILMNTPHTAEASGDTASFNTDMSAKFKELTAEIVPVQDLHGYDNPWPAGGGVQLIPYPYRDTLPLTKNGITFTDIGNGRIHAQGTATSSTYFNLFGNALTPIPSWVKPNTQYTLRPLTVSSKYFLQFILYGSPTFAISGSTFTTPNDFSAYTGFAIVIGVYNGAEINTDIFPMLEYGSVAHDFAPYSNICPITGFSEAKVWDDPKYGGMVVWNQLLNPNVGRQFTVNAGQDITQYLAGNTHGTGIPFVAGHRYLFMWTQADTMGSNVRNGALYNDGSPHYQPNLVNSKLTKGRYHWLFTPAITIATGNIALWCHTPDVDVTYKDYVLYDLTRMFGSTIADYIYSLEQANEGAGVAWFNNLFPNDYYEYNAGEVTCVSAVNGDPYRHVTVQLGQTVYGGTLDVRRGKVRVTHRLADLGTWNWTMYSVSQGNLFRSPAVQNAVLVYDGLNIMCSNYPTVKASARVDKSISIGSNGRVDIIDTNYSDATAFKTAMDGVQLVYELAEPFELTVTPETIKTLVGENNVWADTGPINELKYWKH